MYYILENDKIVLFDSDKEKLENTLKFMPQYEGLEILETDRNIVQFNSAFYFEDEIKEELAQAERERVAMLSLTRGDVFRGLLLAKQITRTQIRTMIENNEMLSIVEKEMALIDFDEALNFYRGNALIDTLGLTLGITSKQLDKFFETNDFKALLDVAFDLEE